MKHVFPLSQSRPVAAQVRQGIFLSLLQIVLNGLVKRIEDKKAGKPSES